MFRGRGGIGPQFAPNDWRQLTASTNDGIWGYSGSKSISNNFASNQPIHASESITNLNYQEEEDEDYVDEIEPIVDQRLIQQPQRQMQPQAQRMVQQQFSTSSGQISSNAVRQMARDIAVLKQENAHINAAIGELQRDRENLRTAVRKLKVENARMKAKLKRMGESVKRSGGAGEEAAMDVDKNEHDEDYDDIGQFLLIGGPKDPLGVQFQQAPIQDAEKVEHKTCERYYWYKMAEAFDDKDSMQKILTLDDGRKAEAVAAAIKNFDQAKWNEVKLKYWEEAQRLKFEQHRSIKNLLVKTGSLYLAVTSQDKILGTGWRKNRQEAGRTAYWDGENQGGKALMKMRDEFLTVHVWNDAAEEQDALKTYNEHRRITWKPIVPRNNSGGELKRRMPPAAMASGTNKSFGLMQPPMGGGNASGRGFQASGFQSGSRLFSGGASSRGSSFPKKRRQY